MMASSDIGTSLPKEWDEEDCSFQLREIELSAFSCVVSAFRAQGMLNTFKEVLLEHLKSALFVSEEDFQKEMRRAANDDTLTSIASCLNPSYDTFTQWGMLGADISPIDQVPMPTIYSSEPDKKSELDELLALASLHNITLQKSDSALSQLLKLPKTPFVPERLRKVLRDSESLHTERILPPADPPPPAAIPVSEKPPASRQRKRRSKAVATTETRKDVSKSKIEDNVPSTSASAAAVASILASAVKASEEASVKEKPMPIEKPVQNGIKEVAYYEPDVASISSDPVALPSTSTTILKQEVTSPTIAGAAPQDTLAAHREFLNKIQQQLQDEARNGVQSEPSRKRKKPVKPPVVKDIGPDCARCRIFHFEPGVNGVKPPRGNPDKVVRGSAANKRNSMGMSLIVPPASVVLSPPHNAVSYPTSVPQSPLGAMANLSSGVPPISGGIGLASSSLYQMPSRNLSPDSAYANRMLQQHTSSSSYTSQYPQNPKIIQTGTLNKRPRVASVSEATSPSGDLLHSHASQGSAIPHIVRMSHQHHGSGVKTNRPVIVNPSTVLSARQHSQQQATPPKFYPTTSSTPVINTNSNFNSPVKSGYYAGSAGGNHAHSSHGNLSGRQWTNSTIRNSLSPSPPEAVSRPVIKRSVYTSPSVGTRMVNGTAQPITRIPNPQSLSTPAGVRLPPSPTSQSLVRRIPASVPTAYSSTSPLSMRQMTIRRDALNPKSSTETVPQQTMPIQAYESVLQTEPSEAAEEVQAKQSSSRRIHRDEKYKKEAEETFRRMDLLAAGAGRLSFPDPEDIADRSPPMSLRMPTLGDLGLNMQFAAASLLQMKGFPYPNTYAMTSDQAAVAAQAVSLQDSKTQEEELQVQRNTIMDTQRIDQGYQGYVANSNSGNNSSVLASSYVTNAEVASLAQRQLDSLRVQYQQQSMGMPQHQLHDLGQLIGYGLPGHAYEPAGSRVYKVVPSTSTDGDEVGTATLEYDVTPQQDYRLMDRRSPPPSSVSRVADRVPDDQDEGEQAPVTDILQQSMMEIS